MTKGNFYSGTSGIVLPVRNKLQYPSQFQDKSRLTYYSSLYSSLEINSSFYKIPQAKTVQKWASEVGDNFKFTFKLWKGITHNKGLAFSEQDVARFMEVIDVPDGKKGCLLVQFPASIKAEYFNQFRELLIAIQKYNFGNKWQVAVEFRSKDWYNDETFQLLKKHGASLVTHDMPASATPIDISIGNCIYLRFHGPSGKYGGSYDDGFLSEYASYINDWQHEGKTVYVYFNNTLGDAIKNLIMLNKYVAEM